MMPEEKKLTSKDWYATLFPNKEVVVLDPDGWDRTNFQFSWFEELITEQQFHLRVMSSTCKFPVGYFNKK